LNDSLPANSAPMMPRRSTSGASWAIAINLVIFICTNGAGHDLMHTVQAERALMQPFIAGCGPWQPYCADHEGPAVIVRAFSRRSEAGQKAITHGDDSLSAYPEEMNPCHTS
jgi:hypothetical protein